MVCPICSKFRGNKEDIINHAQKAHREQLPKDMSTYRYLYKLIHGRDHGICVVCGNPTEWNDNTQKPNRLCHRTSCREKMRSMAKKNMDRVYGEGNYPVNDPEHQKLMAKNRKTSSIYKFKDGGTLDIISKDEGKLLEFLETTYDMTSKDIVECPYVFYYDDQGKRRAYIPDFYLVNYNLIIEQKDGGNTNPQFLKETRYKVKLKAEAVERDGRFNYIIVYGGDYEPLMKALSDIRSLSGFGNPKKIKAPQSPFIIHNESVDIQGRVTKPLYFGILRKDGEPKQLLITDRYSGDIVYCGNNEGIIAARSLASLDYDMIMMYKIEDNDGMNEAVMDELETPIQLANMTPDEFILYLLAQSERPVFISNKVNNNERGENVAIFSHKISKENIEEEK